MNQIKIGTCVPGNKAVEWIPHMINAGFETLSINFHMSLYGIDLEELAPKCVELCEGSGTVISTVGFYCNAVQNEDHFETLKKVIAVAPRFGATHVSTFAGAYEGKSVPEAMERFGVVFRELAKRAADNGLKLGIENCPMGGNWNHCTCNIGFNPLAWEMMFNEVPDDNFGLEWEPTHQMCQLIDPMPQLREWVKKIVHVHGKDGTVDYDAVKRYGMYGAKQFVWDRIPGMGDCNWRDIIFLLHRGGYEDDICVEGYHDPIYVDDWEMTAQLHALNYLKWCRGGDFTPNPW